MNGQPAGRTPRFDPYAAVHKGLRALMADTLLALGRTDASDAAALQATTERLLEMLEFCRSHAHHENEFLHPAIEARSPGTSSATVIDHTLHEQAIEQLKKAARQLPESPAEQRAAALLELYRGVALFVAHNLEHLHHEETTHNATLWAYYTDAQIEALHDELVASIEPEQSIFIMRWMLPAMNPAERAHLMRKLRATAPPPSSMRCCRPFAARSIRRPGKRSRRARRSPDGLQNSRTPPDDGWHRWAACCHRQGAQDRRRPISWMGDAAHGVPSGPHRCGRVYLRTRR